jgi:hypothetical protein
MTLKMPFLQEWEEAAAAESRLEIERILATSESTRRVWVDPALYQLTVGVDFGGGYAHFYELETCRCHERVPLHCFVERILSFPAGTLVIAEQSGFRPQTAKSLAQPLREDQIVAIRDKAPRLGITVMLFPHQHTTRARTEAANKSRGIVVREKTDDMNDAKALAFYVRYVNGISLTRIPKHFGWSSFRKYGSMVRKRANTVLGAMKARGYEGQVFPGIAAIARDVFQEFAGYEHEAITEKLAASIVALTLCEIDGNMFQFVKEGRPPGAHSWRRHVWGCSPFHQGAGIARANAYRDCFRPLAQRVAISMGENMKPRGNPHSYIPYGDHTPEQAAVRAKTHQVLRSAVRDAYRFTLSLACDLPRFEILDKQEATDGTRP